MKLHSNNLGYQYSSEENGRKPNPKINRSGYLPVISNVLTV
jgi:hypothetical protein